MASFPYFPRALLREKAHSWNLAGVAAAPGQTAKSVATIIRSDGGGFWTCSMTDVQLSGAAGRERQRQRLATLLWRAVRTICDGGVRAMVVWRNDALFRPWPAGVAQIVHDIPFSDGSHFSDGSGWGQAVIDIRSNGAAALRATVMNVEAFAAGQLVGGESFSIEHDVLGWRHYEIGTVSYTAPTLATITFLPPLREAIADNTPLEFDRPRCLMRLADTGAMDLTVVPWTFNQASASFVEAFPPPPRAPSYPPYVVVPT